MIFPPSASAPQMKALLTLTNRSRSFPRRVEWSLGPSSWHCDAVYLRIALYTGGWSPMKEQHLRGRGQGRQVWYTYHLSSFTYYLAHHSLPVECVPAVGTKNRWGGGRIWLGASLQSQRPCLWLSLNSYRSILASLSNRMSPPL